tara:strand:+ start:387 stop:527 length:141 start_codon:yes stop_codon:yes gene_type:complete
MVLFWDEFITIRKANAYPSTTTKTDAEEPDDSEVDAVGHGCHHVED